MTFPRTEILSPTMPLAAKGETCTTRFSASLPSHSVLSASTASPTTNPLAASTELLSASYANQIGVSDFGTRVLPRKSKDTTPRSFSCPIRAFNCVFRIGTSSITHGAS